MKRLTDAERATIAELRGEKGWAIWRIANRLGVSDSTVGYHCLIQGIERPGPPPTSAEWTGPMVCLRNGVEVRRFTAEEDSRLLALDATGISRAEIGRRMGRKPNTVKARLATLARREERMLAATEDATT